ncbi:MAG: hypothetical protein V7765_07245 [Oleispira sp.]
MKIITLVSMLFLFGCASNQNKPIQDHIELDNASNIVEVVRTYRPHLWTGFKILKLNPELCSLKGQSILKSLGFKSVTRNLKYDKAKYAYGNFNDNRAAITCAKLDGQTVVYSSIAGPDAKIVERLRNEIIWKF